MEQSKIDPAFLGFSESCRTVSWPALLLLAEKSLDIVVYYWPQWTHEHFSLLKNFLQKGGYINFYMADLTNRDLARQVRTIFPHNTREELEEKMKNTYKPLQDFLIDAGLSQEQVKVFFIQRLLPYSLQRIDNKRAVISLFPVLHDKELSAPSFVLDLEKSSALKNFFEKELQALPK